MTGNAPTRVVDVAADDPRAALRGQRKLVAARDVAKHEVLGHYAGALLLEAEFRGEPRSFRDSLERERYAFRVFFDDITVVVDAWPDRGDARLMAMNDCRAKPAAPLQRADRARQNVEFVCVFLSLIHI